MAEELETKVENNEETHDSNNEGRQWYVVNTYSGHENKVKENLEKRQKFASRKERDTLELDSASLDLYSGNLVEAKRKLVEVRDRFDELERQTAQKTGESLLQYWTDDNMVSYEGEDYEKVMIRVYLAIADLLDEGHDCKAYAS